MMRTPTSRRLGQGAVVALLIAASGLSACKDQGKESAAKAAANADMLANLVDKDVGEVDRGLPDGAKKMAALYAQGADPKQDLPAVRRALIDTQREVPDLNIAKSTFFALADDKGIGIRNNLESDAMAGQDLLKLFPDLSKAIAGQYVTTTGAFPGPATPTGQGDRDWIAAAPVKSADGKVVGLYVTGWAYRRYAVHLQEALKRDLQEALKKSGDTGKLPVFYVGVFDPTGVYTERTTPQVNEKALADAKLVDKTKAGPYQGTVTITERKFGYAAKRTPKLGPDTGVVVLRSEL